MATSMSMLEAETAVSRKSIPIDGGAVIPITSCEVERLIAQSLRTPLSPSVFPWIHGVSLYNTSCMEFFKFRSQSLTSDSPPSDLDDKHIVLIRAGATDQDDFYDNDEENLCPLTCALSPCGLLDDKGEFRKCLDDTSAFTNRNFARQPALFVQLCNIVVYAPSPYLLDRARELAARFSHAQAKLNLGKKTYLCQDIFPSPRTNFADNSATNNRIASNTLWYNPFTTDKSASFTWGLRLAAREELDILHLSAASIILIPSMEKAGGFYLGNRMDYYHLNLALSMPHLVTDIARREYSERGWRTFVDCDNSTSPPCQLPSLSFIDQQIRRPPLATRGDGYDHQSPLDRLTLSIPGLISPDTLGNKDIATLLSLCKLLYLRQLSGSGVLIYCDDGLRGNGVIACLYIIYCTGGTLSDAISLIQQQRPFLLANSDTILVKRLEGLFQRLSPYGPGKNKFQNLGAYSTSDVIAASDLTVSRPLDWMTEFNGQFPAKILPMLYLGPRSMANKRQMIDYLNIKRIISIGEPPSWAQSPMQLEQKTYFTYDGIQFLHLPFFEDDGFDTLQDYLADCIDFMRDSYNENETILVHCQAGVSRSAAVVIAEVMRRLDLSLPDAYLFVRVRRLHVIIQPNLRLMYDLFCWEQQLRQCRGAEWPVLCREIARLNNET